MTPLVWLRSDWTHVVVALDGVVFVFVFSWGAYKNAHYRVTGRALRRTRFTLAMDILAELGKNALGAINKWLLFRGDSPLFPPTSQSTPEPSPPRVTP